MSGYVLLLHLIIVLGSLAGVVRPNFASERAECADQLVGMAACVTYVGGQAPTPTPDCCTGLRQVLVKSPKCLCILIKDHDEPGLAIKINVTLAVRLPTECHVPANISDCPKALNLPKDSKGAKIFEQFGSAANGSTTSGNHAAKGSIVGATAQASGGVTGCKFGCLGVEMQIGGAWAARLLPLLLFQQLN